MPYMCNIGSGYWSQSGTWGLVTGVLDSEGGSVLIPTTPTTGQLFTMGTTANIMGVAIKVAYVSGNVNNYGGIGLGIKTSANQIMTGSIVLITGSVLPIYGANQYLGWLATNFQAPITLQGGGSYTLYVSGSRTSVATLFTSTANNSWSRFLITDQPLSPVSGNRPFILGRCSGGATPVTTHTVIYDYTGVPAIMDSIDVGAYGILQFDAQPNMNYQLMSTGTIAVSCSGTLNMGTAINYIPSSTHVDLAFMNITSNIQNSLVFRQGSTWNAFGAPKARWSYLTSNVASGALTFGVVTTEGWGDRDSICAVTTNYDGNRTRYLQLSGVLSNTSFSISGTTTQHAGYHIGSMGGLISGEIINTSSNVRVIENKNIGSVGRGFVTISGYTNIDINNVEFGGLGLASSNMPALRSTLNATGHFSMNNCTFNGYTVNIDGASMEFVGSDCPYNSIISGCFIQGRRTCISTRTWPVQYSMRFQSLKIAVPSASNVPSISVLNPNDIFDDIMVFADNNSISTETPLITNIQGINLLFPNTNPSGIHRITCKAVPSFGVAIGSIGIVGTGMYDNFGSGWVFLGCGLPIGFGLNATPTEVDYIKLSNVKIMSGIYGINANASAIGCVVENSIISGIRETAFIGGGSVSTAPANNLLIKDSLVNTKVLYSLWGAGNQFNLELENCKVNYQSYTGGGVPWSSHTPENTLTLTRCNDPRQFTYGTPFGVVESDYLNFNGSSPSMKIGAVRNDNFLYTKPLVIPVPSGQFVSGSFDVLFTGTKAGFYPLELYLEENYAYDLGSGLLGSYLGPSGTWQTFTFQTPTINNNGIMELKFRCYGAQGPSGIINVDNFNYVVTGMDTTDLSIPYAGAPYLVRSIIAEGPIESIIYSSHTMCVSYLQQLIDDSSLNFGYTIDVFDSTTHNLEYLSMMFDGATIGNEYLGSLAASNALVLEYLIGITSNNTQLVEYLRFLLSSNTKAVEYLETLSGYGIVNPEWGEDSPPAGILAVNHILCLEYLEAIASSNTSDIEYLERALSSVTINPEYLMLALAAYGLDSEYLLRILSQCATTNEYLLNLGSANIENIEYLTKVAGSQTIISEYLARLVGNGTQDFEYLAKLSSFGTLSDEYLGALSSGHTVGYEYLGILAGFNTVVLEYLSKGFGSSTVVEEYLQPLLAANTQVLEYLQSLNSSGQTDIEWGADIPPADLITVSHILCIEYLEKLASTHSEAFEFLEPIRSTKIENTEYLSQTSGFGRHQYDYLSIINNNETINFDYTQALTARGTLNFEYLQATLNNSTLDIIWSQVVALHSPIVIDYLEKMGSSLTTNTMYLISVLDSSNLAVEFVELLRSYGTHPIIWGATASDTDSGIASETWVFTDDRAMWRIASDGKIWRFTQNEGWSLKVETNNKNQWVLGPKQKGWTI